MAGHIFISYSRRDAKEIDRLANQMKDVGHDVWLDRGGISGGDAWDEKIAEAVADCKAFILALSPDSVDSRHVKKELHFALEKGRRIIPVIIKPTRLPDAIDFRLGTLQRIDINSANGIEHLIDALGGKVTSDITEPLNFESRFSPIWHNNKRVIFSVMGFIVMSAVVYSFIAFPKGTEGRVKILVTKIERENQEEELFTSRIIEAIQENARNEIVVEHSDENISTLTGGGETARRIGRENGADMVIWGIT